MASPVPATANQFLDLTQKSGVLDSARFAAQFPDPDALPSDPAGCANALIKAGLLTRYQAEQLLAGRFRGFRLGPYKILQPLGKGGMGMVYLGEHADLKRRVAIKVLPQAQAADNLARERFFREGRAAAALDHPNIVRLHDISQAAGVHYLALEYVDGDDLESLVRQKGAIPCAQAVHFACEIAAGLGHAHERGFVHRDIKPSNIMLGKDGAVKLLDMGLARSFENADDNLTANLAGEGEAVGTADYVSPEQALGQEVDARGDIYSLGATLFSLLSGHAPFKGNMTQLLLQHQLNDLPPLPRNRGIPDADELDAVIATMTAKDPDDRYQSAAEVIEALAPWLTATPRATTDTPAPRAAKSTTKLRSKRTGPIEKKKAAGEAVRAKKTMAIGIAAAGLLLLVAVVVAVVALSGGNSAPAAKIIPPPTTDERRVVPFVPPQGHQPPPPQGGPPPAVTEVSVRLGNTIGPVQDIAYSRDGKKAAVIDHGGPLLLWEMDPPRLVRPISPPNGAKFYSCAFTPDGTRLVVSGQKMPTMLVDCATGGTVREYPGHIDTTWGVAISPDGETLLTCGNDASVTLRKLVSGDEIRTFELDAKQQWCVAFSADGKRYAAGCGKGPTDPESFVVRVWDTASGAQVHKFAGHSEAVRWVTFRGDGNALATASFDGTVRLWNLTTGQETANLPVQAGGYVERVFFVAGGKQLVTCGGPLNANTGGEAGAVRLWDVASVVVVKSWGGEEASGIIAMAASPTGEYALTGGRTRIVRLWKLPK